MAFLLNGTPVYTGVPFWKEKPLRIHNFCLPSYGCETDSAENAYKEPPPGAFQDGRSELRLASQIAFKFLLNLDRGTYGKNLLTQAVSGKLVFVHILPKTNYKPII